MGRYEGPEETSEQVAARKERARVARAKVEKKIEDVVTHGTGQLSTSGMIRFLADLIQNQAGQYK